MRSWSPLIGLLVVSCSLPGVVETLDREAPPPAFGRPGWVRTPARVGAWVGGVVGGVASLAVLPVTYPISLVADEPLGVSQTEFMFMPATFGASFGHFLLGAPPDMLHFIGYRAWVDPPESTDYEYTPMRPPMGPVPPVPTQDDPAEGTAGSSDEDRGSSP